MHGWIEETGEKLGGGVFGAEGEGLVSAEIGQRCRIGEACVRTFREWVLLLEDDDYLDDFDAGSSQGIVMVIPYGRQQSRAPLCLVGRR